SLLYRHGENRLVWPHIRIAAPIVGPASSTSGVRSRARGCAAVANPTGPAPITTTGSSPIDAPAVGLVVVDVVVLLTWLSPARAGGLRGQSRGAGWQAVEGGQAACPGTGVR